MLSIENVFRSAVVEGVMIKSVKNNKEKDVACELLCFNAKNNQWTYKKLFCFNNAGLELGECQCENHSTWSSNLIGEDLALEIISKCVGVKKEIVKAKIESEFLDGVC